jgi:osmotically-inducible protein OsmY
MKRIPKRLRLFASTLGVVVLLSASGGCAGNRYSQSTGEYLDDSAITAKVKASLAADKDVKAREVQVETFKGTVQLSGFVDNNYEKQKAEELAKAVKGVAAVENKISVK